MTQRRVLWGIVALLLMMQAAMLVVFRNFEAEDSYIVYRYVRNAVAGEGLVYNVGERITALTSPAHALLLTGVSFLVGHTPAVNRVLSVALLLAIEVAVLIALRRRPRDAVLFAAVVAVCPFVNIWSVGGLETMYLLCAVTALVLLVRSTGGRLTGQSALAASVLLGLGFLLRYDAVVFLLPVAIHLLLRNWRLALPLIGPGLAMALGWFAFSQGYFHDILPTSFYIKRPTLTPMLAVFNLTYEMHFHVLTGVVFAVAWPVAFRRSLWLFVALMGVVLYGLSAATTHMFFAYRLFVPFLPAVMLLVLDCCPVASTRRVVIATALIVAMQGFSFWWMVTRCLDPRLEFVHAGFSHRERNLADYQEQMRVFVRNAEDLNRHAAAHPLGRPPRVWTFAGGHLPYHCPDAYVFEALVSYRLHCLPAEGTVPSADYIHVMFPLFGEPTAVLGKPLSEFEVVSAYKIWLADRKQTVYVLHQPHPKPNPLPPTVDGACKGAGD